MDGIYLTHITFIFWNCGIINFVICLTVSHFNFLSERDVVFSVVAVLDEFNVRNHKKGYFNLIPMNDSTF